MATPQDSDYSLGALIRTTAMIPSAFSQDINVVQDFNAVPIILRMIKHFTGMLFVAVGSVADKTGLHLRLLDQFWLETRWQVGA